ncbi:hypothetical protein AB835_08920 [Candidatus Endobugula sertula]|uniref:Leucine-binding protein domain-containing protein n=1 Tax=Candidatus Endobugula sertula TaxID=62101 RepID=A0A1D2QP88_9GAMM|nr:hypothetical protein AB835_08920 [Candidatus Endobugula sertula]
MIRYLPLMLTLGAIILFAKNMHAAEPIHLYIDADRTGAQASGIAIEQGIRVALDEVGNQIAGRPVKVMIRDHHGSSVRSKRHLKEYLSDDQALVVFSGLHSPPLLENLSFINEHQILILDPWATAGPITRYPSKENWVFRLSVDDTKAGAVIVNSALKEGFKKPYLLLEETGWGRSNHKNMTAALKQQGITPLGVQWFNWNLGATGAKIMLRNIIDSGADVILLVANAAEGKTFAKAMLALVTDEDQVSLPIRSHWGITGGDFPQVISVADRRQLDLKFLQTRFSFVSSTPTPLSTKVLSHSQQLFPNTIKTAADIKAPTGFIHAYDLTRLFIVAVTNSGLSDDIKHDRQTLRSALENIDQPIEGLIKTYQKPFSTFSNINIDAHEALSADDFVMAYFNEENNIVLDQ